MQTTLNLRFATSLSDVDPGQWNACANPGCSSAVNALTPAVESVSEAVDSGGEAIESVSQAERFNPFLTHAFLMALEASGSVGGRSGWSPAYVLAEDGMGALAGAAPAYIKTNSMGEYVFDHAWADAFQRAGGNYYPKIQVSVPFTPATGRRLLVARAKGTRQAQVQAALMTGLRALRQRVDASSIHLTFLPQGEWTALGTAGFLQRTGQQFHFHNKNYTDFEGFLGDLASRKRKMIRRERKEALAPGIEIVQLTGDAIGKEHWDAFFGFYIDTGNRKWGRPYLTRDFFARIGATMPERVLLVMARRAGKWIAGAINFIGDDALYGRNWGAVEEHPFLHFEVCYYQAMDFAIARSMKRVEAGAQGEHKLARGYSPVTTYSAHEFADPRMTRAIQDYLARERERVAQEIELYSAHMPFRHVD